MQALCADKSAASYTTLLFTVNRNRNLATSSRCNGPSREASGVKREATAGADGREGSSSFTLVSRLGVAGLGMTLRLERMGGEGFGLAQDGPELQKGCRCADPTLFL